jgi:hypothetical protein
MHERIVFTIAAMEPASIGSSPYAVARLLKAYGDLTLIPPLEELSANCPRRVARNYTDWCAARFEDFPEASWRAFERPRGARSLLSSNSKGPRLSVADRERPES